MKDEFVIIAMGFGTTIGVMFGYMIIEYQMWAKHHYPSFWKYVRAVLTGKS